MTASLVQVMPSFEVSQAWTESEVPQRTENKHLLDMISDYGYWKAQPTAAPAVPAVPDSAPCCATVVPFKQRLYVTVSIMDLRNIDPLNDSFAVKFTLYCIWPADLGAMDLADVAERTRNAGGSYDLSQQELDRFNLCALPIPVIFNAISVENIAAADVKVYGGHEGSTFIFWKQSYRATIREKFELNDFPYGA
jgi:hypothetical protein